MDSYAMKAATQMRWGIILVMSVMYLYWRFLPTAAGIIWSVYWCQRDIFDRETGVSHSQAVLWLIVFWLGFSGLHPLLLPEY